MAEHDRAAVVTRVALTRWLHKLGGSGPSCLLPVHGPSQRLSSAAPKTTSIPVSEIQLGDSGSFPPPSLSSASWSPSPSLDTATRTLSTTGENAPREATGSVEATGSDEPVGTRRSGSPSEPPAPPAAATSVSVATTTNEDAMKVLLVIIAANITLLMNIKDINSSWKTEWKVLYGIFMALSLVSTVTSLFTALSPADSWGTFSAFSARFGLLVATALFVIFLACQLGHFGSVAGVPTAALIVLLLTVVWWNCCGSSHTAARPTTDICTASDSEPSTARNGFATN